jgi:large subunit ribosomal protein L22
MGARKKLAADARKEAMKTVAIAQLRNVPTSTAPHAPGGRQHPWSGRGQGLGHPGFSTRHASEPLYKLLRSAIANWEAKNEGRKADEAGLVVKSVQVNEARGLKRMLPAPQGRAYRMKKRSNHVSLIVDTAN